MLPAEVTRTRPPAFCARNPAAICDRPALWTHTNKTSGTRSSLTERSPVPEDATRGTQGRISNTAPDSTSPCRYGRDERPGTWHDGAMSDDLIRVWAGADHMEAELLRGRLEAEGISVLLKGEGEGVYRAGPTYLFVPVEQEAAARAVIDALASGAYAITDEDLREQAPVGDDGQ